MVFLCLYCPNRFKDLKSLIAHYNLNHAPEGEYILLPPGQGKDNKVAGIGSREKQCK